FRIVSEKVAEIFVIYNEDDNGDRMTEEIIRKVIMPNARSFCRLEGATKLGREFIGTRADFQTEFQQAMNAQCQPLGIEIVQALITNIYPPEQVRTLVEDRSLAERTRDQYTREIEEQKIKEQLAIETEMVNQKRALVEIEEQIVRIVVLAEQEQGVALTEANKQLEVSRLRLEASMDEAAAILARGKAEADVIGFQNEADAAGWKRAVEAFGGDGGAYARYVLLQKMAPSYQRMMVNTADSPIMSIFESFAPPEWEPPRPTPLRPDAVTETEIEAPRETTSKSPRPHKVARPRTSNGDHDP
ncbi:MAG: SPFH domain-containing protein, partial [Planctomycetaceae bacterium]